MEEEKETEEKHERRESDKNVLEVGGDHIEGHPFV